MEALAENCIFNVGGCFFSIPLSRLYCFQESLLLKGATTSEKRSRLFIDRDGCTFRHVHYYINTGKLPSSCASEVNMLYDLATGLKLQSLQQALENLQSGKHYLRARPKNLQVTERATLNYWKTRICNTKQENVVSPVYSVHDSMPLGLVGTPLVESEEEVLYCFVPLKQVCVHPGLLGQDNLLWLCDEVAIIECSSRLFRFIANFLQSGTVLLPEQFSDHEALCAEARIAGVTEFIEALQEERDWSEWGGSACSHREGASSNCALEPLYALSLGLLVKYPDSTLGQLHVESNLEGSRFYITGTGVLFQHVQSWLGTSCLPLTRSREELPSLCAHLDKQDGTYLAIREALRDLFHRRDTSSVDASPCSASVITATLYKVIKVYAGTHWYATYFKTLIKHPEFLCNSAKSSWIVFGESLLVKGDGQMFRHVLNFLRCGRLLLPEGFREWPLLCQEIEAFQIPALSSALLDCSDYRTWCNVKEQARKNSLSPSQFNKDTDDILESSSDDERESPDYTLHSSDAETNSSHSESKSVCPSFNASYLGTSGIEEWRPEREETMEEEISAALQCDCSPTPMVKTFPSTLSVLEELMRDSARLPPGSAVVSGQASGSWEAGQGLLPRPQTGLEGGRTPFPLPSLWESCQDEDVPPGPLDLLTLLVESSAGGSRLEVDWMSSAQSTHRDKRLEHDDDDCGVRVHRELPQAVSTAVGVRDTFEKPGCPELQGTQCCSAEQTQCTHTHSRKSSARTLSGQRAKQRQCMKGGVFPFGSCMVSGRGCVLRVVHPPVLGKGEAGGYFTHSAIYTAEQPQVVQPAGTETKDVVFAYFSLSYEEMVYARECHAFLTGTILNSSLLDPKETAQTIISLVYYLWTGHTTVEDSVQELLSAMRVEPHEQPEQQAKLTQWLRLTLPLAQRYAECVGKLLRKTALRTDLLFPLDQLDVTAPQYHEYDNCVLCTT